MEKIEKSPVGYLRYPTGPGDMPTDKTLDGIVCMYYHPLFLFLQD